MLDKTANIFSMCLFVSFWFCFFWFGASYAFFTSFLFWLFLDFRRKFPCFFLFIPFMQVFSDTGFWSHIMNLWCRATWSYFNGKNSHELFCTSLQVWFQNRRAKCRKHENQMHKGKLNRNISRFPVSFQLQITPNPNQHQINNTLINLRVSIYHSKHYAIRL